MSSPASPRTVEVAGGHLALDVAGQGTPIVFVHAAIADRRMWGREFEQRARQHTVVRYDCRGLGQSPPARAAYSDVADLLAVTNGIDAGPITLVGCSNGGRLAIDFTLEHPRSVRALLLVAPGVSGYDGSLDPDGTTTFEQDGARSGKIVRAYQEGRRNEAIDGLLEYWCSAQQGENRALCRQMIEANATEIFTDASAQFNQSIAPPAAGRLAEIKVLTTILLGDHDEPSMSFIVRRISRGIPGARFLPIAGADHLVNLSRPVEFDAALDGLLRGR